jgi:hypothetical protein
MQRVQDVSTNLWVSIAIPVLTLAAVSIVTALRPADDREILLRGLPPPTATPSLRLAELRRNVRWQARHQLVVAFWLGVAVLIVGVLAALSVHEISMVGVAGAVLLAAYMVVTWYVFASIYLLARYLGARQRLKAEAHEARPATENSAENSHEA